ASRRVAIRLNATHGSGSSGTNVLCTGVGSLLCWADTGPAISKIATEIRIALMLRLLGLFGIVALLRPLVKHSHKRPGSAREVSWNESGVVLAEKGTFSET